MEKETAVRRDQAAQEEMSAHEVITRRNMGLLGSGRVGVRSESSRVSGGLTSINFKKKNIKKKEGKSCLSVLFPVTFLIRVTFLAHSLNENSDCSDDSARHPPNHITCHSYTQLLPSRLA